MRNKHIASAFLSVLIVAAACTADPASTAPPASEPTAATERAAGSVPTANPTAEESGDEAAPSTAATIPSAAAIQDIDFFDGFAHHVVFDEEQSVVVEDGIYESDNGQVLLIVEEVKYGDIDGDGDDEAAVYTLVKGGGTGIFGRLGVWDLVDGQAVETAWIGAGDRAHGGLAHYEFDGSAIITENFQSDSGACCPTALTQTRWHLSELGLLEAERIPELRFLVLTGTDRPGSSVPELGFLPGTSAAIMRASVGGGREIVDFEAGVGQRLHVRHRRGAEALFSLLDSNGLLVGGPQVGELQVELPASGLYRLAIEFEPEDRPEQAGDFVDAVVDVRITDDPVERFPGWTSVLREVVVQTDPDIVLTAFSPRFEGAGPALDEAIEAWVLSETDWWVDDLLAFPPVVPDDITDGSTGGSYELNYTVTGIGDGLIAVRWQWYEYVCCRPYPNHGHKAMVVDLNAGRILAVDEILNTDRIVDFDDRWHAIGEAQEVLPRGEREAFSSLGFTPAGLEVGTDRRGAAPGALVLVPWSELDGLVQPGISERMQAATTPIGFN